MVLVAARVIHRLRHAARQRRRTSEALGRLAEKAQQLNVLVVGVGRLTEAYIQALAELGMGRVKVAGIVGSAHRHVGRLVANHPVLGRAEDVEGVLNRLEVHGVTIDRIVIAMPFERLPRAIVKPLMLVEQARRIPLQFLTEALDLDAGSREVSPPSPPQASYHRDGLRGPARSIAPLVLESEERVGRMRSARYPGSVLSDPAHRRAACRCNHWLSRCFLAAEAGTPGRPFHLYKFRTMGASHTPDGRRLPDTHRMSKAGKFMRRTRLDELPQLINILRGDMSFVGPRPLLPQDQPKASAARLLVRPGLTGWAQVVGGRDISPEDKAALDFWYVRKAGLLLDLGS